MRFALRVLAIPFVAVAGCGTTRSTNTISAPTPARSAAQVTIFGAQPGERRALRGLLKQLAPTQIASVRISVNRDRGWKLPDGALVLTVGAPTDIRGVWEANLLASDYLADVDRLHLRAISLVATADLNGGPHGEGRAVDNLPRGRAAVRDVAPVRRAIKKANARIVELRTMGGALAVTVQTDDPASFLKHRASALFRLVSARSPSASFVGVKDKTGELVYAVEHTGNSGGFHARPDLRPCGPVVPIGLIGPDTTRCAAR
jgi:hypothetical protein